MRQQYEQKPEVSKADLDREIDAYMAKTKIDADMDATMLDV